MKRNVDEGIDQPTECRTGGGGGRAAPSDSAPAPPASPLLAWPPTDRDLAAGVACCLPQLQSLARRLSRHPDDAADLVQETCLRALEHWRGFVAGSIDDLRRWLRTIMHNLHCDRARAFRREVGCSDLEEMSGGDGPEPCARWRLVDDRPVAEAVSGLPPRLRGPYVLFVRDQLSYASIAASLRIPENTVGTRIRRARGHLREALRADVERAARREAVIPAPEIAGGPAQEAAQARTARRRRGRAGVQSAAVGVRRRSSMAGRVRTRNTTPSSS
jgi:RNA polymerase sigma-70 factor (ECF subfamily)